MRLNVGLGGLKRRKPREGSEQQALMGYRFQGGLIVICNGRLSVSRALLRCRGLNVLNHLDELVEKRLELGLGTTLTSSNWSFLMDVCAVVWSPDFVNVVGFFGGSMPFFSWKRSDS